MMHLKKRVIQLLILAIAALAFYCYRMEPTPEELIADAFDCGDAALSIAEDLSLKKISVEEALKDLAEEQQEMQELIDTWHQLSSAPRDEVAEQIFATKMNNLKLKSRFSKAAQLYQKLESLYRKDEAFRQACQDYYDTVMLFPGMKRSVYKGYRL